MIPAPALEARRLADHLRPHGQQPEPLPCLDEQLRRHWHAQERRRVWARLHALWQRELSEALDQARRAS